MAAHHHAESGVVQPEAEQLPVRPDVLVSEAAARNWSVLDVEELKACGLSGDGIWVRSHNGHLHQMHRGVYAVGHAKVPLEGCFLAAVKACGPGAWLSGVSAGALWEIISWDFRLPEVVVFDRSAPDHPLINAHETNHLPPHDITIHRGVPVTSPLRTLLDLSAVLDHKRLRRAVRESQARKLVDLTELIRRLGGPGPRRGRAGLRRIVATGAASTRSELEDVVLDLLLEGGIAHPEVNVPLWIAGRKVIPDFCWPEQRLVLEADGAAFHDNPVARAEDAERQALLEANGWRVLRVTWAQAVGRGVETLRRVRAAGAPSAEPGVVQPEAEQLRTRRAVRLALTVEMISTNQFKNGNHIEVEGTIFKILEFQHVKPGKGGAFVRTKLRRSADGAVIDRTFRAGEKFRPVRTEARKMQFLYADGSDAHFMDEQSFEQLAIPESSIQDPLKWIKPSESVDLLFIDDRPSDVQLAASVELEVTHTEPGVRGDTASGGGNKPATLETGATIHVPLFVNIGDRVKVDTRSGSYMSRA